MIGRVENIERSVAEFVVSKLGLFQRRLLMNDDEGTGVWGGAYGIVDEPSADHLVSRQEVRDLPDVPAGGAIHSTAASMEPRSVGKDRRFHRKFRGVRKRSDFPSVLIILLGKGPLSLGVAIVIHHAFDVTRRHRMETQRSEIAQEGHRHPRFISVRVSNHHPGPVCLCLQQGAKERIKLGIHQNYMFAIIKRLKGYTGCRPDRSGYFNDNIDCITGSKHGWIIS
jgi:hypothetical protein